MKFKNILVVDDSSTSRTIIQRCFQIAGFPESNYSFAENGLEALTMIKSGKYHFDLIVTDLNMPKLDGENLIKKIKSEPVSSGMTIIVISSMAESLLEEDLKKAGVFGVIKKPISPMKINQLFGG